METAMNYLPPLSFSFSLRSRLFKSGRGFGGRGKGRGTVERG